MEDYKDKNGIHLRIGDEVEIVSVSDFDLPYKKGVVDSFGLCDEGGDCIYVLFNKEKKKCFYSWRFIKINHKFNSFLEKEEYELRTMGYR